MSDETYHLFVNGEPAATLRGVRVQDGTWWKGDFYPGGFRKDLADTILWIEEGAVGGGDSIDDKIQRVGWADEWAVERAGGVRRPIGVGLLDFAAGYLVWRFL